jgi:hypothetical protein
MAVAFPGESAEYRAARNRLLDREIELRGAMEAVAAARRICRPAGWCRTIYAFEARGPGGAPAPVRLSELFAPGKNSLVIYSMMFPRAADDDSPGPPGGQTALLPLAQGPVPVVHRPARSAGWRGRSRRPVRQPRGRREGAAQPPPRLRRRTRLAASAPAVLGRHHLQPRLLGRDRRRRPAADAERVSPRRADDPPLLGLGAVLRSGRPWARTPPRRHHRAAVEPVRLHPRGPPGHLA